MHSIAVQQWVHRGFIALAAAAALQWGGVAAGRDRAQQGFTASANSTAAGRIRLTMKNDADGRLDIRVRGLAADQAYDVLVGSVKVGTIVTTGGGQGALRFRTRPRGRDLILGFDPRGALLTLRDASGRDVLVATIPTSSTSDPNKIACCKPDDSGTECEERTADACVAEGGTPAAATSCLPNPCADVPPPANDIICCVPDDSGPECEDRTAVECAARGGIVVQATSCTPNPCAATPPADGDIRCCLPDDGGPECEDRTSAQCAAQGGVDMGPGSCSPNPCAPSTPGTAPGTPTPDDQSGRDDSGSGHGGHGGGENQGGATYYGVAVSSVTRGLR